MLFILPCESKLPKCHFLLVLRTGRSASNGFSQSLTENVFSSSFLVDSFAAYRILGWQFSSVYILSFNSLLVSTVSGDRSAVIEWMAPLYRRSCFSLAASKIFSFSLAHNSLTMHRYGALCIYATWGLLRFLDELFLKYIFGHYFFKWFFCVCCPNHGCNLGLTEPLSPLTCLSSRLSLQSIRPRAGLLPTTLNWVSPFSPLQRSCWSSQPAPAKQNLATNKAPKGHGRSPRPKVTDSHCSPQSSAVSSAQTLLRLLYASGVFPECWNSWFFGSILSCFIAFFLGKGSDNLSSFNHS